MGRVKSSLVPSLLKGKLAFNIGLRRSVSRSIGNLEVGGDGSAGRMDGTTGALGTSLSLHSGNEPSQVPSLLQLSLGTPTKTCLELVQ